MQDVGAVDGDFAGESARLLRELQESSSSRSNNNGNRVAERLAAFVGETTALVRRAEAEGMQSTLQRSVELCEVLSARGVAQQVAERFARLANGASGAVGSVAQAMHARVAALLQRENARLKDMAAVLDRLAFAGDAVEAWAATRESTAAHTAAHQAHQRRGSNKMKTAALKEARHATAKQAQAVAAKAEQLDSAVILRRIPAVPETLFSPAALLAVGRALREAGAAAGIAMAGEYDPRPFVLGRRTFQDVLRKHWLHAVSDADTASGLLAELTTALCGGRDGGATAGDGNDDVVVVGGGGADTPGDDNEVLVDWREFMLGCLLSGGALSRGPTAEELVATRTALHGASAQYHRASVLRWHEDDNSYDVAYFAPRDDAYVRPLHQERRVAESLLRPVSHEQHMAEQLLARWDPKPAKAASHQKYADGAHVEARRAQLTLEEFSAVRLWFQPARGDGVLDDLDDDDDDLDEEAARARDAANVLKRLFFELWARDEELEAQDAAATGGERGRWLQPLELLLSWCAQPAQGTDPRHHVGFHRALLMLSRPVRPRYLPVGHGTAGPVELREILHRHDARRLKPSAEQVVSTFITADDANGRRTFNDLCEAPPPSVVLSPAYALVRVYDLAAKFGLY
jgi:hypothetical protein